MPVKKTTKVVKEPKKGTVRQKTVAPKTKKAKPADGTKDLLDFVVQKLDDGKAGALTVIDIQGKSSLSDYLVLATGTSSRHVMALIHNLAEDLKKKGIRPVTDGMHGDGSWVVLDLGDIIVHVLNPEARTHFALEEIWA